MFKIILILILLEIGLRISGHLHLAYRDWTNPIESEQDDYYKILVFGDSITYGDNASTSWPAQLENILNQARSETKFKVFNKAVRGDNTLDISSKLDSHLEKYDPQMVITMMGITDNEIVVEDGEIAESETTRYLKDFRTYKLSEFLVSSLKEKIVNLTGWRKNEREPGEENKINEEDKIKKEIELIKINMSESVEKDLWLGKLYQKIGQHEEAERKYIKILNQSPKNADAAFQLVLNYLDWDRFGSAKSVFKSANLNVDEIHQSEIFVEKGIALLNENKFLEAEFTLKTATIMNPSNTQPYFVLGVLNTRQNRFIEAEEMFQRTLSTLKTQSEVLNLHKIYTGLGQSCLKQGKYEKAEENLLKSMAIKPDYDGNYFLLGYLYYLKKEHEKAEEILRQGIELNPEDGWSYFYLGQIYKRTLRPREAVEFIEKAIELEPTETEFYLRLADIYYRNLDDLEKAEIIYKMLIESNPLFIEPILKLGWLYQDLNRSEEAEKNFKRIIEIDPNSTDGYYYLGWLYQDLGRKEEARDLFKKVITIKNTNPNEPPDLEGYIGLAWNYFSTGESEKAEKLFKIINQNNPKALATIYMQIGNHYLKEDKFREAEEMFARGRQIRIGSSYNLITQENHREIYEILNEKGIIMVAVQYPTLSIEDLKAMFIGNEEVFFVDNEKSFQEALTTGKYNEYFKDNEHGSFGHGTKKSNEIIAKNTAKVILDKFKN